MPSCSAELLNTKNEYIGRICHIEAALPGGPRFNPEMSNEERRQDGNLLLLCATCSDRIDGANWQSYPVEYLRQLKQEHEARVGAALGSIGVSRADYLLADAVVEQSLAIAQILIVSSDEMRRDQYQLITRFGNLARGWSMFEDEAIDIVWQSYCRTISVFVEFTRREFFPHSEERSEVMALKSKLPDVLYRLSVNDIGPHERQHVGRVSNDWNSMCVNFIEATREFYAALMNAELADGNLHLQLTDALS